MPVIATATDEPHTRFAPSAISRAVGSLTAPKSAMVSGLTPSTPVFTSSVVGDDAAPEEARWRPTPTSPARPPARPCTTRRSPASPPARAAPWPPPAGRSRRRRRRCRGRCACAARRRPARAMARASRLGVAAHHQLDVVDRARGAEVQRRAVDAGQDARQAVVDVRFAHAVQVPGARRPAAARPARPAGAASRGITSSVNIFSISRGTPGRKNASAVAQRHHEPRRDPGRVGQRPRAVRDAHLTQVVGRQLEAVRREPLLHRIQRRFVGRRAGRRAARPRRRPCGRLRSAPGRRSR